MSFLDRIKGLLPRQAWYVPSYTDRNVFAIGQVINKTTISAALNSAHIGDLRYFSVLKQEMRASDAHLSSEVEKVEGLLTRSFEIAPAQVEGLVGTKAKTREAQLALDAAAFIRDNFLDSDIQMDVAIKHAFSGILDAVAGLQIVVDGTGKNERLKCFEPVATERFRYLPGTAILAVQPDADQADEELVPVADLQALGGLVLIDQERHISSPARRGIMRRLLSAWLTKRYGFEYWALFVQLMGIPLRKGTYKLGDDRGRAELEAALKSAGAAPYVAFPDTTDVQFVSGLAGGAVNVHKDLVEHCEGLESKALTGGKQTSQITRGEGSQASSQTHERMLETRVESYAATICQTFRAQAFRPMVERRFGFDLARAITPRARIRVKGTDDLASLATAVKGFREGGFTAIALDDLYERGGLHEPSEGQKTLQDLIDESAPELPEPGAPAEGNKPDGTPAPSPGPEDPEETLEALSAGSDLADTLKSLEAAAVKLSRGAGDAVVKPYADLIKEVAKEGGDLGHLANRVRHLEATNAGKTPAETADVIAAVCARALLTGYTREATETSRLMAVNQPREPKGSPNGGEWSGGGGGASAGGSASGAAHSYGISADEVSSLIADSDYPYHGLRVIGLDDRAKSVKVGDELGSSYHWVDDNSTGKKIGGTSAVEVRPGMYRTKDPVTGQIKDTNGVAAAVSRIDSYSFGRQVVLLGSDRVRSGQDPGEVVMSKPKVLAILWSKT